MQKELNEIISPIERKACFFDGILAVLYQASEELHCAPNPKDEASRLLLYAKRAKGVAAMLDLATDELESIKATIESAINNAYKGA